MSSAPGLIQLLQAGMRSGWQSGQVALYRRPRQRAFRLCRRGPSRTFPEGGWASSD